MKLSALGALLALTLSGCPAISTATMGMVSDAALTGNPKNSLTPGGANQTSGAAVLQGMTTGLFLAPFGPVFWKGGHLLRFSGSLLGVFAKAPDDRYGSAISLSSETLGWAVGNGVARFNGDNWIAESTDIDPALSVTASASQRIQLTDVAFASGSTTVGYAVGTRGTVLKYDATTFQWASVTLPAGVVGKHLGTVKIVSPTELWVAGEAVAHYAEGAWSQVALPSGIKGVSGLAVLAAHDVWASTGTSLIHWDGSAWSSSFVPETGHAIGTPQFVSNGGQLQGVAVEPGVPGGNVYVYKNAQWQAALTLPADVGLDALALVDAATIYAKSYDNSGVWKFDGSQITRVSD